jgi:hypothetical protein
MSPGVFKAGTDVVASFVDGGFSTSVGEVISLVGSNEVGSAGVAEDENILQESNKRTTKR